MKTFLDDVVKNDCIQQPTGQLERELDSEFMQVAAQPDSENDVEGASHGVGPAGQGDYDRMITT